MSKQDPSDQVKFLVCCIGHTSNGRPDFQAVATELGIVTKAAAQKRYERMLKGHGVTASPKAKAKAAGDDETEKTEKTPKATPTKRKAPAKAAATPTKRTKKTKSEETVKSEDESDDVKPTTESDDEKSDFKDEESETRLPTPPKAKKAAKTTPAKRVAKGSRIAVKKEVKKEVEEEQDDEKKVDQDDKSDDSALSDPPASEEEGTLE